MDRSVSLDSKIICLNYNAPVINKWVNVVHCWNDADNQSTWTKPCTSTILSTTNPTWTDPGLNPGLNNERMAT
jgi:hypothetical protein